MVVASDGLAFVLGEAGAVLSLPPMARGDRLVIERGGDTIELKKLRKGRWRIGASPVLTISRHGRDETATGPEPPTVTG